MKIVGMLGAVIGLIISLLLLSFIITAMILSGGSDEENK
mgnify:CR=1 FL=1